MKDGVPQSTRRELLAHLTDPIRVVVLAGIAAVLTVSGPFDTLNALAPADRALYWTLVVFGTYATGAAVTCTLEQRLTRVGLWRRTAIILGAVTAAVTGVLVLIGGALHGSWPTGPRPVADLALIAFLVSALPIIANAMSEQRGGASVPALAPLRAPLRDEAPRILARVPHDRRARLLSLSVEDHYVEVRTAAGSALVLMRLGDAMAETQPVAGLQVHRSHWVARDAIRAARRKGDTAVLTLVDGSEIPVSRRYIPDLRAAGLLDTRDRAPDPATQAGTGAGAGAG